MPRFALPILRTLRDRREKGEPGLSNADIRQLTSLDREQVKYVMRKIRKDGMAEPERRRHTPEFRWQCLMVIRW